MQCLQIKPRSHKHIQLGLVVVYCLRMHRVVMILHGSRTLHHLPCTLSFFHFLSPQSRSDSDIKFKRRISWWYCYSSSSPKTITSVGTNLVWQSICLPTAILKHLVTVLVVVTVSIVIEASLLGMTKTLTSSIAYMY